VKVEFNNDIEVIEISEEEFTLLEISISVPISPRIYESMSSSSSSDLN